MAELARIQQHGRAPLSAEDGKHPACPASSTGRPEQAGTVPQLGACFCSLKQHNFPFPGTETFATLTEFPFAIWDLFELEMQSRDEPWGPRRAFPPPTFSSGAPACCSGFCPAWHRARGPCQPRQRESPGHCSPQS